MKRTLIETVNMIDEQGARLRVLIYQKWIYARGGGWAKGLTEAFDEHGRHVDPADGDSFKVVATSERLTRI
jgi:hypothetical protein